MIGKEQISGLKQIDENTFNDGTLYLINKKNNGIEYILKPFQETDVTNALNKFKKLVGSIQSKSM